MDGLIFVALAVAWAVYLVPKALRHHEEVVRARPVDDFSDQMRVVARRDASDENQLVVSRRSARAPQSDLTADASTPDSADAADADIADPDSADTGTADATADSEAETAPVTKKVAKRRFGTFRLRSPFRLPSRLRRRTTPRERRPITPTQRRRRVLGVILLAIAVVAGLSLTSVISGWWVAAPVGLLVAWLVACRLMVRTERSARRAGPVVPVAAEPVMWFNEETGTFEPVPAEDLEPASVPAPAGSWDPRPVTLPTYVTKPAAQRRVAPAFDADSTGVWSSGRSERDSEIARSAEQAAAAEREAREQDQTRRRVNGA